MDRIKKSYKLSKNIYDKTLTQSGFFSRLYIRLFWGGVDDTAIAEKLLAFIPDDFAGSLLDVPVGTAVFTHKKYKRMKNVAVTCLDYSEDMLEQAQKRLSGLDNIDFVQGDVGNLKFKDNSFDIVLSMNGFHAFPDKTAAYKETYRVLKNGGMFLGCFYIKGRSKITDRLVKYILSPKGWFTPPFETEESLKTRLEKLYDIKEFYIDGSMVYFYAVKK